MTRKAVLGMLAALVVVAGGSMAGAVGLDQTIVRVDLDTSTDATETTGTWTIGETYKSYLVLEAQTEGESVDGMTGVSADVKFDSAVLELVDVYELVGDKDFDGFEGILDLATVFDSDAYGSTDPQNLIRYYDIDRDGFVGILDLAAIFDDEFYGSTTGIPYWTNNAGNVESVEIFDAPTVSNAGGDHPGFVDDLVAVLLLRPDENDDGTADDGSGFSTNAWTGERAVIATMEWKVLASPGSGDTTDIEVMSAADPSLPTSNAPVAIDKDTPVDSPLSPAADTSTVTVQ